ncbi:MAG TPA: hypothetical protein VN922_21300, partial [Bacteroidia bacterium]|nr:hypothetical protein [Bacteroidia bacterium]
NSMQGAYFKPQIVFSTFGLTQYNSGFYGNPSTTNTTDHTGVAIMLNMGKQWILAHVISLDMYAGIGYGLSSNNSNYDYVSNYYSYEITTTGIAFTAGLNIGVVF